MNYPFRAVKENYDPLIYCPTFLQSDTVKKIVKKGVKPHIFLHHGQWTASLSKPSRELPFGLWIRGVILIDCSHRFSRLCRVLESEYDPRKAEFIQEAR